jgi:di/tricarboxylate transporter
MTWSAWITLVVVVVTIVVLARDLIAPSAAMFGAAVVLLVVGIITPAQAFSGFSNPAPITVAALYIVARGIERTGALQRILNSALGSGDGQRGPLARLLALAGGASAFLNNTPIVAMLIGPVTEWAERRGKSPSRFLLPLSFAVILGGMVTLIGTSTNLVVSGLLVQVGQAPLGMFELTPIGLPIALAGVVALVVLAPIVLPARRAPHESFEENAREFSVDMVVAPGGSLDGRTVDAGGLRRLQGVFLAQVERGRQVIAPVGPTTVLMGGDRLTFVGRADLIVDLQGQRGLVSAEQPHMEAFDAGQHALFEAVVGASSPLVGKTLKEIGFRSRYQAAVMAIHRAGERVNEKLGQVELKLGDTLLLLADPEFRDRWRDRGDFLVVSRINAAPPIPTRKAWLATAIALGVAVVAGAGVIPILQASLLGALALVVFGVLSPGEAKAAVDLDVIVLIASAFGVAAAMEQTGLASTIGGVVVHAFGWMGVRGALLGVTLMTMAMTAVITNNAAALLMFPIGMAAAAGVGASPRGFAIAVAIAASASFLSPIGYQTNVMVYGPGGYKFSDYPRLGVWLTAIVVIGVMVLVRV